MAGKAKSVTGTAGNGNRSPYGPRFSSQPDTDKDGDVMGDTDMDMD